MKLNEPEEMQKGYMYMKIGQKRKRRKKTGRNTERKRKQKSASPRWTGPLLRNMKELPATRSVEDESSREKRREDGS